MARGPVRNPIRFVDEVAPKRRTYPKGFVWDEAAKARLAASFDTKETPMATPGPMNVGDIGGPVRKTGKVVVLGEPLSVAPLRLQTVPPGKPTTVPTPSTRQPAVQRFVNPAPSSPDADEDALIREAEAELAGAPPAATEAVPEVADADTETILKRFKGSPDEIAKQLAKSYAASEKRMRQLEAEKNLLVQGKGPAATPTPVSPPPVPAAPVMPQIRINPFDHKTWGDKLLDDPAARAKELDEHFTAKAQAMVSQMFTPLYVEALENRLFRKFPDVVTEQNMDVIKAMAMREEGVDDWEKLTKAVKIYTQAIMPQKDSQTDADVEKMKLAAQQPAPQAKASGAKQWKLSELRRIMARRDYTTDPKWRALVDKAFAEGRVLRDQ